MGNETLELNSQNRIWSFDFFRAYGCLAIVLLHVVAAWRDDPTNCVGFYSSGGVRLFFDNAIVPLFVRMVVPLFFMMSGALFLNPNRIVDNNSIIRHLKRILINIGFFGYFMAIIEIVVTKRAFEFNFLYVALLNLLQEKTWSHLWYLYSTVGLYLITPILRPWVAQISKKEFGGAILVAFILFSVIPTANDLLSLNITQFGLTTPRSAFFWYLLGYYLMCNRDEFILKKSALSIMLSLGAVLTAAFGILSYRTKVTLIQPYHIWVVMYSSAIYLILLHNKFVEKVAKRKLIQSISSCSLVIYIIHPVFLNALYKGAHIYPDRFAPIVGELTIWAMIVLAAIIGALIIKRIPILRKYV